MRDHFLPLAALAGLAFLAGFFAAVFFGIARGPTFEECGCQRERRAQIDEYDRREWYVPLQVG